MKPVWNLILVASMVAATGCATCPCKCVDGLFGCSSCSGCDEGCCPGGVCPANCGPCCADASAGKAPAAPSKGATCKTCNAKTVSPSRGSQTTTCAKPKAKGTASSVCVPPAPAPIASKDTTLPPVTETPTDGPIFVSKLQEKVIAAKPTPTLATTASDTPATEPTVQTEMTTAPAPATTAPATESPEMVAKAPAPFPILAPEKLNAEANPLPPVSPTPVPAATDTTSVPVKEPAGDSENSIEPPAPAALVPDMTSLASQVAQTIPESTPAAEPVVQQIITSDTTIKKIDVSEMPVGEEKFGRAKDFSWVQGQLTRMHHARGECWQVRYAPHDASDEYGGKFFLVGDLPKDFKDGDVVQIRGAILGYDQRLHGAEYRIRDAKRIGISEAAFSALAN